MIFENAYNKSDEYDELMENFNIEDDPEFIAFVEQFSEDLEKWRNTPKVRMINPIKYKQFRDSLFSLVKLLKNENPRAEISYKLYLDNDYTCDTGNCSITVVAYDLEINDIKTFIDSIKYSFGISFMGSSVKDGKIAMSISFRGVYDTIPIDNPL